MSQLIPTTKEMLDLLNLGVAREYQVAIQYMVQHSKMEKLIQKVTPPNILLNSTMYDKFGELLYKTAIDEMKHAGMLMERIYLLNGLATTKVDLPVIGCNLREFALHGIEREIEALDLYRRIITKAIELQDIQTRLLAEKIYAEEEKHLLLFQEYTLIEGDVASPIAPEAGWMKYCNGVYFEILNKAIANELNSIIQYTNQHEKASKIVHRQKTTHLEVVLDTNKAQVISELLHKIALEEMKHFEKIADRLYRLGGESILIPNPLPRVAVESTPEDWCLDDRKLEDQTLSLYESIILSAFEHRDFTTFKLFQEIIEQEDHHFFEFDDFFAKSVFK
jgi:bacterioferritin